MWDFFDFIADGDCGQVLADATMPGARWFPGTRLNYAEYALRQGDSPEAAVISIAEDGTTTEISWTQLRQQVAAFAAWLRRQGVGVGDRVVGYLPNTFHGVIAFLATAGIGAVWSACGQDYGASGAASRFAQLEPTILVAADGYRWNGRGHDRRAEVAELRRQLPTVRTTVHVPVLGLPVDSDGPRNEGWDVVTAGDAELDFVRVDFDAPLWVLFSSGTTGLPKGIVHGHGGVILDHHKLLGLHNDLRPGQRFFWYTTTNWMMWNMVVSGLLVGATIVLYDGSPTHPDPQRLWDISDCGTSPPSTASASSGSAPDTCSAARKPVSNPAETSTCPRCG